MRGGKCLSEKITNIPNRRPVNSDFGLLYMNTPDLDKPLIKAVGISKDYVIGDNVVHALSDVHFSIIKGELVAIMGPSGSGKTTLMNLLGCLDTPTRGQYYLDGINVSELTPDDLAATRSSKLGFVFQSFNLLARTSALSNVQLHLLYSRIDKIQRRSKAEKTLADVGLSDRVDHHPSQLSGGQQQRVAIARALVSEPEVILADEPTGALDTRTGVEIMSIFQRLNDEGMSVIIVTHEADVARFANRIIRFQDGRLTSDETLQERASASEMLASMPQRVMTK